MRGMPYAGDDDLERATESLAAKIPAELAPLAHAAYDFAWSWTPDGREVFQTIDPGRYWFYSGNPVQVLEQTPGPRLRQLAGDEAFVRRARRLEERLRASRERPDAEAPTVAFVCAEFGVHRSLPIYSGGLGVLAGDILKESSDLGLPLVGVGILYGKGVFRQRIDPTGWQQEFWTDVDANALPLALVTANGAPLRIAVPIRGRDVIAQIWRARVGRVPLYLLDAQVPENGTLERWISGRLYVGDPAIRLEQYALLGIGGMRALRALDIAPGVVHVNEGHGAFAPLELARARVGDGTPVDDAIARVRDATVFTTHTPVPAGNETYRADEVLAVLGDPFSAWADHVVELGRVDSTDELGMTSLGLRLSRAAVGVSRLHGAVARSMWHALWPDRALDQVPIGHVTNGVHVPTWMSPTMRNLLDRFLPDDWRGRAHDPDVWAAVDKIPDGELWDARQSLRRDLIRYAREQDLAARLSRYESRDSLETVWTGLDGDRLTLGFARRVATYKRLALLFSDVDRVSALLGKPDTVQFVIAGKAHPKDEEAKASLAKLFREGWPADVGARLVFLEDYDMAMARRLVAGTDVWVNLPRPPMEASGTSGMKAAMNGGINLSVLDGWWAEGYDGENGWAIDSDSTLPWWEQDAHDCAALFDLVERELVPLFHDRDDDGVPRGWIAKVKASMRTVGPMFSATRMMRDYEERVYRPGSSASAP
jgi:glycogen phosphorylase